MLTFTFAGDESDDGSFNFAKGASRYFIVAVIGTQNPDTLRDVLEDVPQKAYLPEKFDFHFHSLLPDPFKVLISGLDFYLYFVSELIRQIPPAKREGGNLILDEYGYPKQPRDELKRIMKAREIKHGFRRISVRRSQSEPLVQIADLVAGAILRRDAHKQSEAYDLIVNKIKKLVEYAE
jgi:hypothetical protein